MLNERIQDLPLDMTNYYSCMNMNYGMFKTLGVPHKPFYVFKAFNDFLETFPCRLDVRGNDPDGGLAVLAGQACDGEALGLFAANHGSDNTRWTAVLRDLPWLRPSVRCRIVDATRDLEPGDAEAVLKDGTLTLTLPRHTVALIEIGCVTPGDGASGTVDANARPPAPADGKPDARWH